jgi:uncharacterized phosphosugar-binding protein
VKPVFEVLHRLLKQAEETQAGSIRAAGELVADCLVKDGLIHVFGTGHSHMLVEELFYRAGGLAAINPILDSGLMLHESAFTSTDLERMEGYVPVVFSRYSFSPADIMIIISNSGCNAGPVEAAMEARRYGLRIIAVTALAYSRSSVPRHSSGKRLFELADIILDNGGVPGDAAVEVEGLSVRICPTSTIIGAALLNAVVYEAVTTLLNRGIPPAVIQSVNLDPEQTESDLIKPFRLRVRHL